ncbi:MAG: hypothetical protein KDE56_29565, partial [Anaerolineales bacterium]|nr:hypothetical protein [Anaerolineales bacterium]
YLPDKLRASEAHASQYSGGPGFVRFLPSFLWRNFMRYETYTRAFPAPDPAIEADLFAGLEPS